MSNEEIRESGTEESGFLAGGIASGHLAQSVMGIVANPHKEDDPPECGDTTTSGCGNAATGGA